MIDEADRDGDGEVSQDEFLRIMKKTSLYWKCSNYSREFLRISQNCSKHMFCTFCILYSSPKSCHICIFCAAVKKTSVFLSDILLNNKKVWNNLNSFETMWLCNAEYLFLWSLSSIVETEKSYDLITFNHNTTLRSNQCF